MTSFYAVKVGRTPGVYINWDDALKQIDGFSGGVYKRFGNATQAYEFVGLPAPAKIKPIITKKILQSPLPLPLPLTLTLTPPETTAGSELYYGHKDYVEGTDTLHIYTDGSTIGNGYHGAHGGYGVFFADRRIANISRRLESGKITNNVAELTAIYQALLVLLSDTVAKTYRRYHIYYDSEYAVGVITGTMRAHTNLELINRAQDLYREFAGRLHFTHVYSHTGATDIHSVGNELADRLAKGY